MEVFPMSISDTDLLKIIQHLIPGDPLSHKLYQDGSLVVIADSGKKFAFSPDQVTEAQNLLKPAKTTTPKKAEAKAASGRTSRMPTSREVGSTPSKPASKSKSSS
jgi:hypothetical protein